MFTGQVRDFGDRLGDQVVSFRDKLERVERELAGMLGRISSTAQKSGKLRVVLGISFYIRLLDVVVLSLVITVWWCFCVAIHFIMYLVPIL